MTSNVTSKLSANAPVGLAPRGGLQPAQHGVLAFAVLALAGTALVAFQFGWRLGIATLIGALAGFSLYHAAFGFTSAWRRVVTERRGAGLRAQMLLFVVVCAVSYPLLAIGTAGLPDGFRAGGFVFPFGVAAAIGAFLFGMGMQFGGGCGSGTLFTAGGGSSRMVVTLAAFIAGSLIATAHLPWWNTLPRFQAVSIVRAFGPAMALAALFAFAALVWWTTAVIERRAHGRLEQRRETESLLKGPWALWLGVAGLAVVSLATILLLGRPWGITSAFALWGAKIAVISGVDIAAWPYWSGQVGRLERSVFSDATSVMNFGIIWGAMIAAALAARFKPVRTLTHKDVLTAIIGGLAMGYGARLAYGCNIGAYLGGIVSGSLHGWWWAVFAFAGSSITAVWRKRTGI
ncbi:MAG: YeeE/YedE family protein [Pseudomonadota bacterium]